MPALKRQRRQSRLIAAAAAATLTAFALVRGLGQVGGARGAVGSAHRAVGDPGLVHAALHPLHDQVQQDVHRLAHALPVGRARLKVRDSDRREGKRDGERCICLF